jgi:hypothetical protein
MSSEFEFLLECLKLRNEGKINFLPDKKNIDWQKWKDLLIEHGVLPQVYMNINNRPIEGFPGKVLEEIKSLFYLNTSRNTMVCSQLNILVKAVQALNEKITIIPYKGPVLAVQAYNDYAFRSYSDLDVLIDKKDFSRFYEHMINLGYQPLFPFKKGVRKWWAALGREYVFSKKDIHVDIHSRIQRGPEFIDTANMVFGEVVKIKLMDHWINALSVEYSLLAICINAAKDGWQRLCYVTDLAYLVWNNRELKWNSLVLAAKKMKVYTMLCIGIKLSNEFFGVQFPAEIKEEDIKKRKVVNLSRIYSNNLKQGKIPYKKFASQILEIRAVDSVWGKFRYLCYYLFVPKISDLEDISIAGFLFPLYFFLRPLFLFIRGFKSVFKTSKGLSDRINGGVP